jgi:hypothetical protein
LRDQAELALLARLGGRMLTDPDFAGGRILQVGDDASNRLAASGRADQGDGRRRRSPDRPGSAVVAETPETRMEIGAAIACRAGKRRS